MAGTLVNVLLFIAVIALALIVITILDWASQLPIFHPSRPDVQNLLTSPEDLLLPMGSFSSELLHPWTPKELSHESNQTTLPLSTTPAPESGRSDLGWQSPITKATHHDGGVKSLAEPSPTTSTFLNGDSNSTMIPPSALPTPNINKSEPSAELPMSTQAITNCGSISEATFALMLSPPDDEGSTLSAMSRWTRRQTGNAKENAGDVHSFTNPATSGDRGLVLDYASDQASSDSTRGQQSLKEISCDVESAVDAPLPEQTLAEIDALVKNSETMSEEVQGYQKQQEEDSTAVAEEVSTESKAPEQQGAISNAAVEEVPSKSQAFELAIRGLVDPDGSSGSNLEDLVVLVRDVSKARAEAEEKLKSEIIGFNKEVEDLRHNSIDQREYIENVIKGQNDFVCEKGDENDRLSLENSRLDRKNSELKEQLRDHKKQYKREIRDLEAEKQYAENAEKAALAGVEGRISKERERHEKERSDAVDKHLQEINSEICQRQMVFDELATTQTRLNTAESGHKDTIKDHHRTIRRLEAEIRRMEPAVAAAVERETATKDRLEKELKDQRKEKKAEISIIQKQTREAKEEARSLRGSLISMESTAKMRQLEIRQLSTRLDEEKASLREDRDHIVDGLKLDKEGLERTIRNGEAEISSLKAKVANFEAGGEVRSLQSHLRVQKKKLRKAAEDAEELRRNSEAQESRRSEEAKRASEEKKDLKNRLAKVVRSKGSQNRKVQELKGQKKKLCHEIKAAESAEEKMRTEMQRDQDEKVQIATRHQDTVREKDEEIIQKVQLQDQWRLSATAEHEKIIKEKDEEIRRLQEEIKRAKNGEVAKNQEIEGEQAKTANQKAAKDAANAANMALQKELDGERQASRDARDKATETETKMRTEISALKAGVNKVEERQSDSNQTSKEAQEKALLLVQANEAINLLLEIGKTGIVQGSPEHSTLCELNEAKLALHKVHRELWKPISAASKPRLCSLIHGINISEERIKQFSTNTRELVEQANKANARGRRLQYSLDTNTEVQKDEMLDILHSGFLNERVIRKPRALKRPGKPEPDMPSQDTSTAGRARNELGQSPPAVSSQPMPKRDHRQPFTNLLASVSSTPLIRVHAAPRQDPAAENQPLVSGASGDNLRPVSPRRPTIRARGPQLAPSASANGLKKDNESPTPQMPAGWTDKMTEFVGTMYDETIEDLEWYVKIEHKDFEPQDDKGLLEWLKKLQSDFAREKSQKKP